MPDTITDPHPTGPFHGGTVAQQNDRFRETWGTDPKLPGRIVATQGVVALGPEACLRIMGIVRVYASFTEDNDPFGTHDFGDFELEVEGQRVKLYWKIDLYDEAYRFGSEAPDDPARTRRLLTLLLPDEW